jgi:hypothetical protein
LGEETKVYKVLVGKTEGKRPFGRPRRRWEDVIRIDLGEIGWGVWSGFSWLRIGAGWGYCECGAEHSGSGATELVKAVPGAYKAPCHKDVCGCGGIAPLFLYFGTIR